MTGCTFIAPLGRTTLALAVTAALAAALPASAADNCDLASFKAPANTTLVSAKAFSEPVNYCRIDGYVTTTNPGPNQVNFMLALPEAHNGRYLFSIQGGAAAFVPDPTEPHLRAGYAIASTDKGVKAAHGLDFSFRNDPAQSVDWAHRGVHVSAVATQDLTRQHYGIDTLHRYAYGCSGGGDGTLSAAEVHPTDFDGYIAAAMTTAPLEISMMWGKIAQRIVTNPKAWISLAELEKVERALLAQYDAADGAVDQLIWDPTVIELDREQLAFLSDHQFGTLQMIQAGIDEGEGAYYPGFWMSNPIAFSRFLFGLKQPPWDTTDMAPQIPAGWMVANTGSKGVRTPDFSLITDFDFGDAEQLREDRRFNQAKGRHSFDPAHLKGLKESGGKLILWSGAADEAVPPQNILDYTDGANRVFGEEQRTGFVRTFLAPGMFHCRGGVNAPDDMYDVMLEAAARWVEDGVAPDQVVASNPAIYVSYDDAIADAVNQMQRIGGKGEPLRDVATTERSYLLCPWPQKSVFKGGVDNPEGLDVKDADNWACRD